MARSRRIRVLGFECRDCDSLHGPFGSDKERWEARSGHGRREHPDRDLLTVGYPDSLDMVMLEWLSWRAARFDVEHGVFGASGICNCLECRRMRVEGVDPEQQRLGVECPNYEGTYPEGYDGEARRVALRRRELSRVGAGQTGLEVFG